LRTCVGGTRGGWLSAACALALIWGAGVHAIAAQDAATASKSTTPAASHTRNSKATSSRRKGRRRAARGQQKIDPERAQEIQEALIREHYLNGKAAGTWNQASEDAMRRYQADHGWQSKTVPDSRALISLGLGPKHDHLLNPDSAMTTGPDVTRGTPAADPVSSHSAAPLVPVKGQPDPAPASPSSLGDSSRPQ
jgi:hypothetical protein